MAVEDPDGPPASEVVESVLADVRKALHGSDIGASDASSLLNLYGSITILTVRAQRIRRMIETRATSDSTDDLLVLDELRPPQLYEFDGFHRELIEFGNYLNVVNLAAVDIYFPGLREDLITAAEADYEMMSTYAYVIAPKHGLTGREMPPTLAALLEKHSGGWGEQNIGLNLLWEYGATTQEEIDANLGYRPNVPSKVHLADLVRIFDLLMVCRETIGSIIREHWQFRDLLECPTNEGIRVEMTEYNITGSQVGAVGPDAHVHDVTYLQANMDMSKMSPVALAEELERLREELAREASERDHYADLVAVSDAGADAREGKMSEALKKLSAVGKWALEVGTKIGVTIATDAIKAATGLV